MAACMFLVTAQRYANIGQYSSTLMAEAVAVWFLYGAIPSRGIFSAGLTYQLLTCFEPSHIAP